MLQRFKGTLMLLMAAFIWGTTFVAQMAGMDELGPFTYAAARFALGFLSLLVLWGFLHRKREQARAEGAYHSGWKAGLGAGCIMFVASSLQQVAMLYTTAGKTAFITCLYIILVPLFAVFLHRSVRAENWLGAVMAVTGLFFLAVHGDLSLSMGDAIVLVSAVFWTFHILFIDHFAGRADVVELSVGQIGICALFSSFAALALEEIAWQPMLDSYVAILYGGVMSAGVAFTLQIVGQKYAEPAHAAILMSFEAIFGALAGWAILGEVMSGREIFGCVLMAAGMIVTQLGGILRKKEMAEISPYVS